MTQPRLRICRHCKAAGNGDAVLCVPSIGGVVGRFTVQTERGPADGEFSPPMRYDVWRCPDGHQWREAATR